LAKLAALSNRTPPPAKKRGPPPTPEENNFAAFVKERITQDTENLTPESFHIELKHKLKSTKAPSAVLKSLPGTSTLSRVYNLTYEFYLRKLRTIVHGKKRNGKEWKALGKLADTLNISQDAKDDPDVCLQVFARLRALDMTENSPL